MKKRHSPSKAARTMSVLERYSGTIMLLILCFAFFTRMYRLHIPEKYMFDEVYHALTIKLIAQNDPRAYEWWNPPVEPDTAVDWLHPPTAKLMQATGVLLFGETGFGWRVVSAISGILVILLVYQLARATLDDTLIALVAAALASLDGLLLVQSRIAMNDIVVTLFVLLTLLSYWRYRTDKKITSLFLTGVSLGLAISSKWSGIFLIGSIAFFELLSASHQLLITPNRKLRSVGLWLAWVKPVGLTLLAFLIIPSTIYLASYGQMWMHGKDWAHFKELHNQIWHYQTHLEATHPYQSQPFDWVFNLKPVWYYVDYDPSPQPSFLSSSQSWRADIYASGNTVLYWLGFVAVLSSMGIIIHHAWKVINHKSKRKSVSLRKKFTNLTDYAAQSPLLFLVISYFVVWLPWVISPRIMFFYHYAPAVPLMCILLSYWMIKLAKSEQQWLRYLVFMGAVFIGLYFVVWYPHWVGIPLPSQWKDAVYFAVPAWK